MSTYRVDHLLEKHETRSLDSADDARLDVDVAGERVIVLVSKYDPKIRVERATRDGDLLLLLGEIQAPPSWGMKGAGVIIVARKQPDGLYAALVWHDLYPGTVEALVAAPEKKGTAKP